MNNKTYEDLKYNLLKEKISEFCSSNLGKQAILNSIPSNDFNAVSNKLLETKEAIEMLKATNDIPLGGLHDISYSISQLEKGYILQADSLQIISDFLRSCRKLSTFMQSYSFIAPTISSYSNSMMNLDFIEEEISRCIQNGKVSNQASKSLAKIRRLVQHEEDRIKGTLNQLLGNNNIKKYLQENFISERSEHFTLCVKSEFQSKIQGSIIEKSQSGSAVFIEPTKVQKHSHLRNQYLIEESEEEYKIISYLSNLLYEDLKNIYINIECMKTYDMLFAKAKYALSENACIPQINKSQYVNIIDAYHPLIKPFKPLSIQLGESFKCLIITGPNAGGKTVALKTLGLLCLAVQSGFPVMVNPNSSFCIFQNILTDIGDSQSIENALSTFSGHIQNIASFTPNLCKNSLLLLDEIGSGTDPRIGAALAISILHHFYLNNALVFASTHYGEIKEFAEKHVDFENARMCFDKKTLSPLYILEIGHAGNSEAFWICERMNISKAIIKNTKNYLSGNVDYSILPNKILNNKENINPISNQIKIDYSKGDTVKLFNNKKAIVFNEADQFGNVKVYVDNNFEEIHYNKLTLIAKACDLYPLNYDLEQLFSAFSDRKLEHDINRGSKKALKKIYQYNKKKQIKPD